LPQKRKDEGRKKIVKRPKAVTALDNCEKAPRKKKGKLDESKEEGEGTAKCGEKDRVSSWTAREVHTPGKLGAEKKGVKEEIEMKGLRREREETYLVQRDKKSQEFRKLPVKWEMGGNGRRGEGIVRKKGKVLWSTREKSKGRGERKAR